MKLWHESLMKETVLDVALQVRKKSFYLVTEEPETTTAETMEKYQNIESRLLDIAIDIQHLEEKRGG